MPKSETFLQFFIFGLTAATVLLLVARIYPSGLLKQKETVSQKDVQQAIEAASVHSSSPPQSIVVPSVNLNLPIIPATIANNKWTLFDDKVSWLATSQTPGNGNVILFAHNRAGLFGNLKKLQAGQEIIVTQDGKEIVYKVTQKRKVTPQDVEAVLSERDQLTLYTCDGSFDEKRLVVIALPREKNKV